MKNMNIWQVSFIIQKSEEEITGRVSSPKKTMPYNKLRTNLACSSRTGEYWPSVVFKGTSLRSVRTATTLGQYSPVRPSRSVSKRLVNHHYIYCNSTRNIHTLRARFLIMWQLECLMVSLCLSELL